MKPADAQPPVKVTITASPGMMGWIANVHLPNGGMAGLPGHATKQAALRHARAWCSQRFGRGRWIEQKEKP